jgi:hypothetical protein
MTDQGRARAAWWARVHRYRMQGILSRGAYALLHEYAQLARLYGDQGAFELGERFICQKLGLSWATHRMYRRQLEALHLVVTRLTKKRGFCRFFSYGLSASIFDAATASNFDAATASNFDAATASNSDAAHTSTVHTNPLKGGSERLRRTELLPKGKDSKGDKGGAAGAGRDESSRTSCGGMDPDPEAPKKAARSGANNETWLMGRLRRLLGPTEMANWGGRWRNRIKENPDLAARVIAEMEERVQDGKKYRSVGGYLDWLWQNWRNP